MLGDQNPGFFCVPGWQRKGSREKAVSGDSKHAGLAHCARQNLSLPFGVLSPLSGFMQPPRSLRFLRVALSRALSSSAMTNVVG